METIVTSDISCISMSTRLVVFGKDEVKIDISKLFKGEEAYLEVTQISEVYGKRFRDWINQKETAKYIEKLEDFLKSDNPRVLEKGEKSTKTRATKVKSPLIIRRAGRYNSGTWLHRKLALKYFRWLDVEFEIAIDMFLEQVYKQVKVVQVDRDKTKIHFHPLTEAIQEHILPHMTNEIGREMIYATFMDFANKSVMGMTAKQFRESKAKEGVMVNRNRTRCYFEDNVLVKVIEVEKKLYTLITTMELENFHQVKALYLKRIKARYIWNYTIEELKGFNKRVDILEKRIAKQKKDGRKTDKTVKALDELIAKYNSPLN